LAFIIVNVFTLENLAPWIDEVMFIDTSYNAAVHDAWETTAWYRVAGQYPFPTYPPLYQMLCALWIWIMGFSLVTVRCLNLLITFALGGVALRFMMRHGVRLTSWTTALFTMLLWGTGEMAWMYRNGRPDMLCCLVFVFAVQAIDNHLLAKSPTTRIMVVATSALLVCSGIQAAICLCALWLFLFIVMKGHSKETIRLLVLLLTGFLLGLLLVAIFMLSHGRLLAFVSSIVQYSDTLRNMALMVLPWVGKVLDFSPAPYIQKLHELNVETSLGERLAPITEYYTFLMLSAVALLAYAFSYRTKLWELFHEKGFLMLLFALCVPVFMYLAGRFAIYYRWMPYLPLVISVINIAARHKSWRVVFSVVAVLLTVSGVKSMLPDGHEDYGYIRSFIERNHFEPSDAVVCPFSVFYEIKPVCDICYFAGIFPTEFLGRVDYIIENPEGNEFDQPITNYVNKLRADSTVMLTCIDRCDNPSLILYQVKSRDD